MKGNFEIERFLHLKSRNLKLDLFPSLVKEGAKREPDRAKHKEMPRHQSDVPKAPFIGADGVARSASPTGRSLNKSSTTAHFIDQHHFYGCALSRLRCAPVC